MSTLFKSLEAIMATSGVRSAKLRQTLTMMAIVVGVQLVVLAAATTAWAWPTCD